MTQMGQIQRTITLVLPRFNCKLLLTAYSSIAPATALSWMLFSPDNMDCMGYEFADHHYTKCGRCLPQI